MRSTQTLLTLNNSLRSKAGAHVSGLVVSYSRRFEANVCHLFL